MSHRFSSEGVRVLCKGVVQLFCPKCGKLVREFETDMDALNKWAFKPGYDSLDKRTFIHKEWDGRGCCY